MQRTLFLGLVVVVLFSCNKNPAAIDVGFYKKAGPILFISDKSGTYQLYSMNEDGSNVQQLTNDPSFPISDAKWSPDGNKIAVVSLIGDSMTYPSFRNAIFLMNSDGSNKHQLTKQWVHIDDPVYGKLEYGGAMSPVWSPDSKHIGFTRTMIPEAMSNMDIFLINIDETNEKRITSTIGLTEGVSDWLKDGSSLLGSVLDYSATDLNGRGIQYTRFAIIDLNGNVLKLWGIPGESWELPIASQNGDRAMIIFVDMTYRFDIYIINLDGIKLSNVTKGICQYPQPVSWSPDDSSILFNALNRDNQGRLLYKILLIKTDETKAKDITPFIDTKSYATSWRRR